MGERVGGASGISMRAIAFRSSVGLRGRIRVRTATVRSKGRIERRLRISPAGCSRMGEGVGGGLGITWLRIRAALGVGAERLGRGHR